MKNEILELIKSEFDRLPENCIDLSDIGNSFALAVHNFISNDRHGFRVEDFLQGIEHGISIETRNPN